MSTETGWRALRRRDFLLSRWPWRAAGYLLAGALTGAVTLVAAVLLAVTGTALTVVAAGVPLLLCFFLLGLPVAAVERQLARLVDDRAGHGNPARALGRRTCLWASAHPTFARTSGHRIPARPGLWAWLRTRLTEQVTWRELGFALVLATVLGPLDLLVLTVAVGVPVALIGTPVLFATVGGDQVNVLKAWPVTSWPVAIGVAVLGLLGLALGAYAIGVVAGAQAALARLLLTPPDQDTVVELTRSRLRLVEAFEAERTRIERDLHDGAQQRLVALTMRLGVARLDAPPGGLADQLARAQDEAEGVLGDLRDLIRGVHPPVLTDFGLPAAVAEVADRSVVPVDLTMRLQERFDSAVEAAVYFVVCEALANMGRHSSATRAEVSGGYADGRLTVQVWDDGRGGAYFGHGTGLTRLGDRASVVDGTLTLSSPPGGPTAVNLEIPCRPRTE